MRTSKFTLLDSMEKLLFSSSAFSYANFNLLIFQEFLTNDVQISLLLNNLTTKYPDISTAGEQLNRSGNIELDGVPRNLAQYRTLVNLSFEQLVCLCYSYLRNIQKNKGTAVLKPFCININGDNDSEISKKVFHAECISPIITYLKKELTETSIALDVLRRYKVLCEWYESKFIFDSKETDITRSHLSKFLFNEGYTYNLTETNVPSGRIDNIILESNEIIVAESKIYNGEEKKVVQSVINQTLKRLENFNIADGYSILINKSDKNLKLDGVEGSISNIEFIKNQYHRVFIIIINVNPIFKEDSTSTILDETITISF